MNKSNKNKGKQYNNNYLNNNKQNKLESISNPRNDSQIDSNFESISSGQSQKNKLNSENQEINYSKILLFPGENYEFDEKLLHYNVFGFFRGNLISKKSAILNLDKSNKKPINDSSEEIIKSIGKYYPPKVEDFVIGTITQKNPEFYKVDIGTYIHAVLNTKEFEGASKKTKPNLNLGDSVFARVLKVNKYDAPILSCISQYDVKNWASGESFFGHLKKGNIFKFPMEHAWNFINSDNYLLKRLNDIINFEIVIGQNGKMWINSDSNSNILDIYNLLIKSINKENSEIEKMVHETFLEKIEK